MLELGICQELQYLPLESSHAFEHIDHSALVILVHTPSEESQFNLGTALGVEGQKTARLYVHKVES